MDPRYQKQIVEYPTKEQAGTLKPNDIYMFRVAAMLGEYAAHGAVLRRYNRSVSKLDGPGAEAVARFQAHLRVAGLSASTVRTYSAPTRQRYARRSAPRSAPPPIRSCGQKSKC